MLISTKGRYALRVMVDLAEHQSGDYVPLKTIAERQEISEKYLETILKSLVGDGFLYGLRGKGGGYKLTRSPEQYTVGEILRAADENLAPVACPELNNGSCNRTAECRTLPVWIQLSKIVNEYLDSLTLQDLIRPDELGNDYVI